MNTSTQTELNQLRTAVLMSKGYKKWFSQTIRQQLKNDYLKQLNQNEQSQRSNLQIP